MKELFKRLLSRPFIAGETLMATLFIAILNLGSPIFVINVLNRYVNYGFDGTLFTLTTGMLIVIALQYGFRIARIRLIGTLTLTPDSDIHHRFIESLTRTRTHIIDTIQQTKLREMAGSLNTAQAAYDPAGLTAVLDAPFSFLYLAAVYILSPTLALVVFAGILVMVMSGMLSIYQTRHTQNEINQLSMTHQHLVSSAIQGNDTVRAFNGTRLLTPLFSRQIHALSHLRFTLSGKKERSQSVILAANLLMSVFLYAIGAYLVVRGELTVGALIGANILGSRACMNIVRLVQTSYLLIKAETTLKELQNFSTLPRENKSGTALSHYSGRLEFKDVSFSYPGSSGPLFESLNLSLAPGAILVVTGKNGTGKTTLARLVTGLLPPSRGEIQVDDIHLTQIALPWWRQQLVYVPQEPVFFNVSIRDNITLLGQDIDDKRLNQVLHAADLKSFIDQSPAGVDTVLTEGGRRLPLGIRKRIAIARALVSQGRIIVFDDPTEGLDMDGIKAVYALLNRLSQQGGTIIVMSYDPNIIRAGTIVLNLDKKPVPELKIIDKHPPHGTVAHTKSEKDKKNG